MRLHIEKLLSKVGKLASFLHKIKSSVNSRKKSDEGQVAPRIFARHEHCISRDHISPNALKVLYRLHNNKYKAYLVGGGVRDLLLGREPKDFDVVTNAKPEQIKQLFKNSLLIGKRFRLVHVRFKDEVIEVSTFRKSAFYPKSHKRNIQGIILRDNVYGSIDDDIWRRDFTINALYYNIADFSVADYAEGMADLSNGIIRIIGDPFERYREDPVRILRAIRFAGKLGFMIDEKTQEPFAELSSLLVHVPAARLFDEVLKMLLSGYSAQIFSQLKHYNLFGLLFPGPDSLLRKSVNHLEIDLFLVRLLTHTDRRLSEGKSVTPAYLFAGFLWHPLLEKMKVHEDRGLTEIDAFELAFKSVVATQTASIAIPKFFVSTMKEIWRLQFRFSKRLGRRSFKLLYEPRFRAAYDFLLLRSEVDIKLASLANWWTEFSEGDEEIRQNLVRSLKKRSVSSR